VSSAVKARLTALAAVVAVAFPTTSSAQTPRVRTEQAPRPVVVEVSEGGFAWGDAAIGAAAATGAALAVAGVSMVRRQLRKEER
jgi:hypothetical protein